MFLDESCNIVNQKIGDFQKESRIAIWGAGENTVRLLQYTNLLQYTISYVIDKKLRGQHFFGWTVIGPEEMLWDRVDVVIITAFEAKDEIRYELEHKIFFQGDIVAIHDYLPGSFQRTVFKTCIKPDEESNFIIQKNKKYNNIHKGERVFILCTGPTIADMDLIRLKNERTIAVNSFYLHKECSVISPDYYCEPAFEEFSDFKSVSEHLQKMSMEANRSHFFFGITEKETVDKIRMYKNRNVNYLFFGNFIYDDNEDVDLVDTVMAPQSVSIMALEIAIYMGFQTIYLLGTEHDSLVTKQYRHFYRYETSIASKQRDCEDKQGDNLVAFDVELDCTYHLWKQYKVLKKIAARKGIKIYNATPGGMLDVFERINYGEL